MLVRTMVMYSLMMSLLANNCSFEGWVVESAGVMEAGKGYMTFLVPGSTVDFVGTPNTGSITTPAINSGGGIFNGADGTFCLTPIHRM